MWICKQLTFDLKTNFIEQKNLRLKYFGFTSKPIFYEHFYLNSLHYRPRSVYKNILEQEFKIIRIQKKWSEMMITIISKTEQLKAKLKAEYRVSSLNETHHISAISSMNTQLALARREYQVKDRKPQIIAATVILTAS